MFDQNAITLGEYAMLSNDPVLKKVTFSLYDAGNVLADLPVRTEPTLKMNGMRFTNNLPGVNWVPINTDPVVTKGKPTPYSEQLYLVRNRFQIDKILQEDQNQIQAPLDVQWNAWEKSFAYDFNTKFINNYHTGQGNGIIDPNFPMGIRGRLDNAAEYGIPAGLKFDAGGVDLSPTGVDNKTNASNFIEIVQTLLDNMNSPNGDGCVIYMNANLMRRFERAIRTLGGGAGFSTEKDAFDRDVPTYRNAKVRYIGRRVDQSTEIILSTEDALGNDATNGTFTSMYVVRYGDDYLTGWQPRARKPSSPVLDPISMVSYNVVLDWGIGFMQQSVWSMTRAYDIKIA